MVMALVCKARLGGFDSRIPLDGLDLEAFSNLGHLHRPQYGPYVAKVSISARDAEDSGSIPDLGPF